MPTKQALVPPTREHAPANDRRNKGRGTDLAQSAAAPDDSSGSLVPSSLPRIYLASRSSRRRELLKQIGSRSRCSSSASMGCAAKTSTRRRTRGAARGLRPARREGKGRGGLAEGHAAQPAAIPGARGRYRRVPARPDLRQTRRPRNRDRDAEGAVGPRAPGAHRRRAQARNSARHHRQRERRAVPRAERERDPGVRRDRRAFDKAGGYAIQGRAATFIPEILGSYTGVMGLPLYETASLLRRYQARFA